MEEVSTLEAHDTPAKKDHVAVSAGSDICISKSIEVSAEKYGVFNPETVIAGATLNKANLQKSTEVLSQSALVDQCRSGLTSPTLPPPPMTQNVPELPSDSGKNSAMRE